MKPNDILEYRCPTHGIVWQWRVHSVCLGAPKQESLIEISPVMAFEGETTEGEMETVWVPEPMTRGLSLIIAPDNEGKYGLSDIGDLEDGDDGFFDDFNDDDPFGKKKWARRGLQRDAQEPCFDTEGAADGVASLTELRDQIEKEVRQAKGIQDDDCTIASGITGLLASDWRQEVRKLTQADIIRATSHMRAVIARLEEEADLYMDEHGDYYRIIKAEPLTRDERNEDDGA